MKTTGRKVLVAFRTLPGESDSALVIQTENLSDSQHDAIIKLVESPAGQNSYEFAEVLARTSFPDGSTMLSFLHVNGRLTKVKTSEVEMTPNTFTVIGLDELNQLIAEQRGISINDLALGNQIDQHTSSTTADNVEIKDLSDFNDNVAKTTSASVNESPVETAAAFESPEAEAKFYRSQADKLAKQAAEMRRKAEELAPAKKKVKSEA